MKVGVRKPNLKKSIKARTTGKVKRQLKSSVNPLYGKKGTGMITDPKKAVYNKVYNKTTVGVRDIYDELNDDFDDFDDSYEPYLEEIQANSSSSSIPDVEITFDENYIYFNDKKFSPKSCNVTSIILYIVFALSLVIGLPTIAFGGWIFLIIGIISFYFATRYRKLLKKYLSYKEKN